MIKSPYNYFVKHIYVAVSAALKKKKFLCQLINRYNTDTGGQATSYHNSHKIAFSLWQQWIRIVECGILVIKKTSAKTLQIKLYSVFLSVPISMYKKKKREKKFDCKRKRTFFYLNFSSIATLKIKDNDFLCQLCLVNSMYF